MHFRGLAIAFQTAENRGASDLRLPAFLYDRLIEGFASIAVALRNMNAQQLGRTLHRHQGLSVSGRPFTSRTISTSEVTIRPSSSIASIASLACAIFSGVSITEIMTGRSRMGWKKL